MESMKRTAHIRVLAQGDKKKQQLLNNALMELVDEVQDHESKEVLERLASLVNAKDFSESYMKIEEAIESMPLIYPKSPTKGVHMPKMIIFHNPFTNKIHAKLNFSRESTECFPESPTIQIALNNGCFFLVETQESNLVSIYRPKFKIMTNHIYLVGNTFLYFEIVKERNLCISYKSPYSRAKNKIKTKQNLTFGLDDSNNFCITESDSDSMNAIGEINYTNSYWEISLTKSSYNLSRCLHTKSTISTSSSTPLQLVENSDVIINQLFLKISIN